MLFNNPLDRWLVALVAFVTAGALLWLARRIAIARIGALATRTKNTVDDFVIAMLQQTRVWFLLIAAAAFASRSW